MAIRGAPSSPVHRAVTVRFILAVALTAGAFLVQYDRFRGSCMIPGDTYLGFAAFVVISIPFVLAFVWLTAEAARLLRPRLSWGLAICLGLMAYAAIGAGVWISDPRTALEDNPGADFRLVMSAGWSWGILLEAGAFSDYSCGY